jgi:hypothetical protein
VLADELGLAVAGAGDYTSALAAYGGVADELGRRARTLLPLGAVTRVEIEDENRATECVRAPGRGADPRLLLVTLSAGSAPTAVNMSRLLAEAVVAAR